MLHETPAVAEFAQHLAADAKILEAEPDTGAQNYKYIRAGPDHYSLAFTGGQPVHERRGAADLLALSRAIRRV